MGTNLIFSCLRNEGPFLLEWVSFHMALGFDHFMLFTNDCDDQTDAMADRLQELGIATHIRNLPEKRGPQWTALNSASLAEKLATADWAMHLDIDEFVNIESLATLIKQIGQADAISLPWRFFGSGGAIRFADRPVLQQFRRCSTYPIAFPRQALMFKTLYRPSQHLSRPGVHAPRPARGLGMAGLTWLQGDGRPVSKTFGPNQPVLFGSDAGNSLGQINHYAVKSRESFLVKSARGLPNHGNVPVDLSYWARRNLNDEVDDQLANRDVDTSLADDPVLSDLHQRSVEWHRARIKELLATPAGIELFSAIAVVGNTVVPPENEIKMLYHHLGRVFGKKSDGS